MFDHLPVLIQVDRADVDNMVRVLIDTHPGAVPMTTYCQGINCFIYSKWASKVQHFKFIQASIAIFFC